MPHEKINGINIYYEVHGEGEPLVLVPGLGSDATRWYRNLPGLVRKYYLRSEDGRRAGGVYLWESRAAAEACYGGEWKARVEQLYGSTPEILWFDTPVIVDNSAGGTIVKAA